MWTSTNYFLVNLSITDLLLTVLNGLFNFIYMRDNNWIFGDIYCTINNFVAYVTVAASVLTLTAITLDRYVMYSLPNADGEINLHITDNHKNKSCFVIDCSKIESQNVTSPVLTLVKF